MNSTPIDTLIDAAWIIPVAPRDRVLQDCSVAIHQGRILAIGLPAELQQRYCPRQHIQLPHHALLPGFVNAHGHAAMSLLRGFADDTPLQRWLEDHIWPSEKRWVSEAFVADGSRLAMAEMLLAGTTCFSDMYFFPEATAREAAAAGMRACLQFPVFDFASAWGQDADHYIHKGLALRDQYRSHALIRIGFGPHTPYTVSDAPLRKIATYAEELQAAVHIHTHETAGEVAASLQEHGKRPLRRLYDLGLLSPLSQCVHMTQVSDEDIALLQETGAHVVHCPKSNLKLASGFCPVAKLLDAGVNVALGSDGAASNNSLDMAGEMQMAALLGKAVASDAAALSAMSALEMATLNGARALGLEQEIGSISIGKQADLIAVDLSQVAQQPLYDPISTLVYTAIGDKVSHVWVAGKPLLHNRQLLTLDLPAIQNTAQRWRNDIQGSPL